MGSFLVVVAEEHGDLPPPRAEGSRYAGKALLLKGAVETLHVSVVGGPPYPRVAMSEPVAVALFREPPRELSSMVRLEQGNGKRTLVTHILDKPPACMRVDARGGESEREATAHIEPSVYVQALLRGAIQHGIDLDEDAWFFWYRPLGVLVPFLPLREPRESRPFQGALHRREAHGDAFAGEPVVEDLRALPPFRAKREDPIHHLEGKLCGVMVRARGLRGDEPPASGGIELHPARDRARFHAEVSCDFAHAPAAICDEPHRVPPHLRLPWICGVCHVHILGVGVAKVVNHNNTLAIFPVLCTMMELKKP